MKSLDPLLPIALLGTGRAGDVAAAIRAIGGAPRDLLEAIAADVAEPAVKVLRSAGVLAQCRRVAFATTAGDEDGDALLPDLASEPPALDGPEWSMRLEHVFGDGPEALQHEVCRAIAERGRRLPAALLPAALDLALRDPRLRPVIRGAAGARGLWLASQRPRWRDTLGAPAKPTEDDWNHGRVTARAAFLRDERARDPDAARDRLRAELPQLGAEERAQLVACLEVGISPADEPLLDALLVDRAGDVRRAAAGLLVRLPESARSRAIGEALAPLVTRARGGAWSIEAPGAEHPRAKALGLEPRPKSDQLGERAFWLYQLARNAPLAFWTAHTGLTPIAVVRWASRSDWAASLVRGMHDALFASPEPVWVSAFLEGWNPDLLGADDAHVNALLPWSDRERAWCDRLLRRGRAEVASVCEEIADDAAPEQRLGTELGGTLARVMAGCLGTNASPIGEAELELALAAVAALPDLALDTLRAVPRAPDLYGEHGAALDAIEELVDLRIRLRALPSPPSSPPADAPRVAAFFHPVPRLE